jgi:hypothetical protein
MRFDTKATVEQMRALAQTGKRGGKHPMTRGGQPVAHTLPDPAAAAGSVDENIIGHWNHHGFVPCPKQDGEPRGLGQRERAGVAGIAENGPVLRSRTRRAARTPSSVPDYGNKRGRGREIFAKILRRMCRIADRRFVLGTNKHGEDQ